MSASESDRAAVLETFPNPNPERDYLIEFRCPEFTCLCPRTGQPDFATLYFRYVADEKCVELKSLKLYLWSFRDRAVFAEALAAAVAREIMDTVQPHHVEVTVTQRPRGGISIQTTSELGSPPAG